MGAIGLCITGGFALSLTVDTDGMVRAPVMRRYCISSTGWSGRSRQFSLTRRASKPPISEASSRESPKDLTTRNVAIFSTLSKRCNGQVDLDSARASQSDVGEGHRTSVPRDFYNCASAFMLCINVQAAATSTRLLEAMTGIDEMSAP